MGENVDTEQMLNFSAEMGRQLMQNGAEIYRVEESIRLLLLAYGFEQTEVFAIPAVIVMTVQDEGHNYSRVIRVRTTSINLKKLHKLNTLCRDLCRETPSCEEMERRFQEVLNEPPYHRIVTFLAHGLVAFFYTFFWGGGLSEALVAFPCGLMVSASVNSMRKVRANVFFTNLVTSALLAVLPLALVLFGVPIRADRVIIGTIMLLVPGIAITNVMRDVLAGDFMTALTRFAEVLIVALGISLGVAVSITAFRTIGAWM